MYSLVTYLVTEVVETTGKKRIDRLQNRSLAFASHLLEIKHPPFGYCLVVNALALYPMEFSRDNFNTRFVSNLIKGWIDMLRDFSKKSISELPVIIIYLTTPIGKRYARYYNFYPESCNVELF